MFEKDEPFFSWDLVTVIHLLHPELFTTSEVDCDIVTEGASQGRLVRCVGEEMWRSNRLFLNLSYLLKTECYSFFDGVEVLRALMCVYLLNCTQPGPVILILQCYNTGMDPPCVIADSRAYNSVIVVDSLCTPQT